MGSLFKSGSSTQKTKVDTFKGLPKFLKEQLAAESGIRMDILEDAIAEADRLGSDPREILQQRGYEVAALDNVMAGIDQQELIGDQALDAAGFDTGELRQGYENEYTDDVVDTTLANMDRKQARDLMLADSRAAAIGGTSNTRASVEQAMLKSMGNMDRAEMEAKLRSGAFDTAAGLGLEEANTELARSGLLDDLATSGFTRDVAGADWLKGYGEEGRVLDQAQKDADRSATSEALTWLSSIFSGAQGTQTNQNSSITSAEVATPSKFSQIMGGVSTIAGVAGMLSDADSKEDIVPMEVGLDALKGVTPVTYKYRDGAPTDKKGRTAGLIAQELEHIPGAVERGDDGYLRVDPYPVLATIVQATKDLDRRTSHLSVGVA